MAKIVCARCDSHTDTGIIDGWWVWYDNGTKKFYGEERPPETVFRFCVKAKYGYKDVDGTMMWDWYCNEPLSRRDYETD